MEFGEKLQEMRKEKGLTQEELAEILYVSRTTVSKWESGRGYPNIESLKDISKFFSVTIDDLLSGERLLSIAEKENRSNIRNVCDLLFGVLDGFSVILIILPLYPNTVGGFIYSVNFLNYAQTTQLIRTILGVMYITLIIVGFIKIVLTRIKAERANKVLLEISVIVNIFMVVFLALTRITYAMVVAFFLLLIKGSIILKRVKADK